MFVCLFFLDSERQEIFSSNTSQKCESATNSQILGATIISHKLTDRYMFYNDLTLYQTHRETFIWLTSPSTTQAVFRVPETVCEGCIVAAVQFRQVSSIDI